MKKTIQQLQDNINDIKQTTDAIKGDIQNTIEQAKESAEYVKETLGELKDTKQHLSSSLQEAKTNMNEMRHETKENLNELRQSFETDGPADADARAERFEMTKEGNGFVIHGRDGLVGEITYTPVDEHTWAADHTYVMPQYRGRDIAQRLLQRVVTAARMENKKIIPACSYVQVQFQRNAEYADVWKK
ncbi:GNAT family N-acetyltransferase [Paenibacillus sp. 1P07SE]|uniref:GNAT family N-acetyltransferase n=1 Tax=Paenibacillus sp. 1P07SE TaxID=3132209 RepID=UPI0039A433F0